MDAELGQDLLRYTTMFLQEIQDNYRAGFVNLCKSLIKLNQLKQHLSISVNSRNPGPNFPDLCLGKTWLCSPKETISFENLKLQSKRKTLASDHKLHVAWHCQQRLGATLQGFRQMFFSIISIRNWVCDWIDAVCPTIQLWPSSEELQMKVFLLFSCQELSINKYYFFSYVNESELLKRNSFHVAVRIFFSSGRMSPAQLIWLG